MKQLSMSHPTTIVAVLVVVLAVAFCDTSPAQGQATEARPAAQAFDQVFSQWKELLKKLRDLRAEFDVAEEADVDAVRGQFQATLAEARQLVPRLRDTGLQAFAESPNADRQLTRFLIKIAEDEVGEDRYEAANEIVHVLLQHNCEDKLVYDLAGVVAFALADFDAAENYFREAESYGVLSDLGKKYQPEVDTNRTYWQREVELRQREAEADDLPRVRLTTSKGEIVVELFENEAPETVGNFISLVESKFYDNLTFHRVLSGFMAQGGCPKGDGSGGPGYTIYCECYREDARHHFRGSLSMAHAGRDTGGSQFFLMFRPDAAPHLNGKHTVFGRVIEGMDVLADLQRRDPDQADAAEIEPDRIVKAEVIRKRDHVYQPHRVE